MIRLGELLVFAEVKTRATFAAAAEALQPAQLARLASAAETFLAAAGLVRQAVRLDAALVAAGRAEIVENVSFT